MVIQWLTKKIFLLILINIILITMSSKKPYGPPYSSRHTRRLKASTLKSFCTTVRSQFEELRTLKTHNHDDVGSSVDHNSIFRMHLDQLCMDSDNTTNDIACRSHHSQPITFQDDATRSVKNQLEPIPLNEMCFEKNDLNFVDSKLDDLIDNDLEVDGISDEDLIEFLNCKNELDTNSDTDDSDLEDLPSTCENVECDESLEDDLKRWYVKYSHRATLDMVNDLLSIFPKYVGEKFKKNLPKDARTLLNTPRTATTVYEMSNGEYCHFGLKNAVIKFINAVHSKKSNVTMKLLVNIDGAPFAKSSEKGLWIISCSDTVVKSVEPVGIFYGKDKPSESNQLVKMFVDEMIEIVNNGIMFEDILYKVIFQNLICDTPAKAYILNVKYPSGYYSCTKCTIKGTYKDHKVCFPGNLKLSRNDADFSNLNYIDEHQKEKTILCDIPNFGPVSNVPADYMHLVCLGVVLKLIELWLLNGSLKVRLPEEKRKKISELLLYLKNFMPSDFCRKPRKFENVRRLWKATELRLFLLYTAIVVLHGILPEDLYLNFLELHASISILINPILSKDSNYLEFAENLLKTFVKNFERLYGKSNVTFNVHNLLHLVDDVRRFGPLDEFSAFRFENFIGIIKKLIRKGDKPLQQISRRLAEIENASHLFTNEEQSPDTLKKKHFDGPILTSEDIAHQYEVLNLKSITIDCKDTKNNCVLLSDGTVLDCKNFVNRDGKIKIIGNSLKVVESFYTYPLDSSLLNIRIVENSSECLMLYDIQNIAAKICKVPYKGKFVTLPVIHSFESQDIG